MLIPLSEDFSRRFYGLLFEKHPNLRPMFKNDLQAQGRKLVALIHTAVASLEQLDELIPAIRKLGREHRDYQVKNSDYVLVRECLLQSLQETLGEHDNEDAMIAWGHVYDMLAEIMIEAADQQS